MTETPPRLPTPEERRWDAGDLLANRPFILCALYLCTYVFGVTFIIGVVLAYVFREGRAKEWELSHFTYLSRSRASRAGRVQAQIRPHAAPICRRLQPAILIG